jgi:hypothetical protein
MRRIHVLGAITLAIFSGPIFAAPALETSTEARQILPRTLVPSHYALSLMPNPEVLTFKGDVQITGTSPTAGRQIVMNAKGLTFDEVRRLPATRTDSSAVPIHGMPADRSARGALDEDRRVQRTAPSSCEARYP